MTTDEIFESMENLPPAAKPGGVYKPVVMDGHLAYFSGHGPLLPDETYMKGRLGEDLSLEEGKAAARQAGLSILATLQSELGSLDRVKRVVKLFGLVNSSPDFLEQPSVINGCSELFAEVFGADRGVGVRSAVGTNVLPGNISVEIEGVVEIEP